MRALIHGFPAPPAAIVTLAGTAAGGNKESTP